MSEQLLEDNRHKSWWRLFWYLVWMQNCDLCPDAKALDWLCGPTIWFSSLHGSLPVNAPLFYQPRVKSKAQCHSGCCIPCSEVGHVRELAWHLFFSGDIAKHIWEENKTAKNTKLYLTGSKLNIHHTLESDPGPLIVLPCPMLMFSPLCLRVNGLSDLDGSNWLY